MLVFIYKRLKQNKSYLIKTSLIYERFKQNNEIKMENAQKCITVFSSMQALCTKDEKQISIKKILHKNK